MMSGTEELNKTTMESQETQRNDDLNNINNASYVISSAPTIITGLTPQDEKSEVLPVNGSVTAKPENALTLSIRKKNNLNVKRTKSEGNLSDLSPNREISPFVLEPEPSISERSILQVQEELSEIIFILLRENQNPHAVILHHPRDKVIASVYELVKKAKEFKYNNAMINNATVVQPYRKRNKNQLDDLGIVKERTALTYMDGHSDFVELKGAAVYIGICLYKQPISAAVMEETLKTFCARGVAKINILFGYHDYLDKTIRKAKEHTIHKINQWLETFSVIEKYKEHIQIFSRMQTSHLNELRNKGVPVVYLETESKEFKEAQDIFKNQAMNIISITDEIEKDATKFINRQKSLPPSPNEEKKPNGSYALIASRLPQLKNMNSSPKLRGGAEVDSSTKAALTTVCEVAMAIPHDDKIDDKLDRLGTLMVSIAKKHGK